MNKSNYRVTPPEFLIGNQSPYAAEVWLVRTGVPFIMARMARDGRLHLWPPTIENHVLMPKLAKLCRRMLTILEVEMYGTPGCKQILGYVVDENLTPPQWLFLDSLDGEDSQWILQGGQVLWHLDDGPVTDGSRVILGTSIVWVPDFGKVQFPRDFRAVAEFYCRYCAEEDDDS